MSEIVTYGGTTFPLPATPAGRIRDPVAHGLADFIAYYLNTSLNPQIALLYPSEPMAVPTAKRFLYDPKDVWPQNGVPALYVHWKSSRSQTWSLLKERAVDTYELTWIAHSRSDPTGAAAASGLLAIAQRAIRLAADRGWHPDYSYNGAPLGEPLHITIGFKGWEVTDTQVGTYRPVPSRAKGAREDYYPTLKATIRTYSIVEQPTPQDPGEARGDSTLGVFTNDLGDLNDTVEFAQMQLSAPDGSEDGDE